MGLDSLFIKQVITADPGCPIYEIAERMQEHGVGAIIIVDDGRPVGIVTDRDLAIELGTGRVVRSEPVRVVMTTPVSTINRRESILTATRRMQNSALRRLPIVDDDGHLAGLVTLDELLILLGRELGNLAESVARELATTG